MRALIVGAVALILSGTAITLAETPLSSKPLTPKPIAYKAVAPPSAQEMLAQRLRYMIGFELRGWATADRACEKETGKACDAAPANSADVGLTSMKNQTQVLEHMYDLEMADYNAHHFPAAIQQAAPVTPFPKGVGLHGHVPF